MTTTPSPAALAPMKRDATNLPYGVYICRDGAVLYDRKYRPLMRFANGPGAIPFSIPAHDRAKAPCPAVVPLGRVSRCVPDERIDHHRQLWFYDDRESPRHDGATRQRLTALLKAIPELAEEVASRSVEGIS